MSDRITLTEAEMTSHTDNESGNYGGASGNDDETDGVKYSWSVIPSFKPYLLVLI